MMYICFLTYKIRQFLHITRIVRSMQENCYSTYQVLKHHRHIRIDSLFQHLARVLSLENPLCDLLPLRYDSRDCKLTRAPALVIRRLTQKCGTKAAKR